MCRHILLSLSDLQKNRMMVYVLEYDFCFSFQNKLGKAMSIFSQIMNPESVACINLNILIHIQSNMLESLMKILEDALDINLSKFVRRYTFSEEVLAKVREKLKDSPALTARFDEVYGRLHVNSQISTYTMDALLCQVPQDKRSNTLLLKKRPVSHRTLQPLSWSLLTE